ncbi:MAG: hypothetical protein ABSF38_01235 [Verrucomicrobiota bacterium]
MSTLAINAGSSSLKFGLFSDDTCERLVTGEIDWAGGDRQQAQLVVRPRQGASTCSRLAVPDDATAAMSAIQSPWPTAQLPSQPWDTGSSTEERSSVQAS